MKSGPSPSTVIFSSAPEARLFKSRSADGHGPYLDARVHLFLVRLGIRHHEYGDDGAEYDHDLRDPASARPPRFR